MNNSHIAMLLYLRVYPSEMCGAALIKLSDKAAPLLINNKLQALHCILAQILLTSPQTIRSIISFAFAEEIDILNSFQPRLCCVCEILEKAERATLHCEFQASWEFAVQ